MPKLTATRQQDRYETILDAGRTVLAAKGFEAASIADIARRAGVSEGTIYRYFTDKRDLLGVVLEAFYHRVIGDLEAAAQAATGFRSRVHAMAETHVRVFAADPELCRLFLTQVRVSDNYRSTRIFELNRRYTSVLLMVVAGGVEEGVVSPESDPRLLRDLLFGGIEHLAWRHIDDLGRMDDADHASRIADILLDGFCGTSR